MATPRKIRGQPCGPGHEWLVFRLRRQVKLATWTRFGAVVVTMVAIIGTDVIGGAPALAAPIPLSWSQVATSSTPSPSTSNDGQAMTFDTAIGKIVLVDNGATWTFDGSSWAQVVTAISPPAGAQDLLVYDDAIGKVVLVDGGTTWTFDGVNWTAASTSSTPSSPSAIVYDPTISRTLLLAASGASTFDGTSWSPLPAGIPAGFTPGSATYDPLLGEVIAFSSTICTSPSARICSQAYSFDGTTWTAIPNAPLMLSATTAFDPVIGQIVIVGFTFPSGGGFPPVTESEVQDSFDGTNWTPQSPLSDPVRIRQAMAYDPLLGPGGKVVLYGGQTIQVPACGCASTDLTDTWILGPTGPLTEIPVTVSGTQSYGSAPTFTASYTTPSGVSATGTVTCATVNGGTAIGSSLIGGVSYVIDGASCTGLVPSDALDYSFAYTGGPFAVVPATIPVTVTGAQVDGGLPTFTPSAAAPSGIVLSGTLTCSTVNGGTPISSSLMEGSAYTIDGATCSGLSPSDPTNYTISYSGGLFTARAAPHVSITPSANPAISGPVVYSVAVTGGLLSPVATGSVSLTDGQGGSCTTTLLLGSAGCQIPESAGHSPYAVMASYSGDSYYTSATATITEIVIPAVAKVVLTPSSNPANEGPVTYTVLVTGNTSIPTGTATVSDGQGGSCTAALVQGLSNCAIIETGLASPFTVTATYNGDASYTTSTASLTNARGVSASPTGTALATLGQTTASATGLGTVNILQYTASPVSTPSTGSTGVYFDVAASTGNSFASEVIQDCDLNGGISLVWWNPAAHSGAGSWQPVIGDPGPSYTAGPPACISATLDANSSPTVAQLTGTVFGASSISSAPTFTSRAIATVTAGSHVNLTISSSGSPTPSLTLSGILPSGITFTDNHNGTGTVTGTLAPKKAGSYSLTLTATNSAGVTQQPFTFVVAKPSTPKFVTTSKVVCLAGLPFTFTVAATSWPNATLSETGSLPPGFTFTSVGSDEAILAGTTAAPGTYPIVVTASNGSGLSSSQAMSVTVVPGS